MISKNIIKNQYTHRVLESTQSDIIEIGAREVNIPTKDLINTLKLKSDFKEVVFLNNFSKQLKLSSLFSMNSALIFTSLILSGIVVYTFLEQALNGYNFVGKSISNEALLSVSLYFLLLSFVIPFFVLKKKFVLKIKNNHLDIKYSLNRVKRISLDEVSKCSIINTNNNMRKLTDLDLSTNKKSYRTELNSAIAVFLKDGRCLLFGAEK